MVARRLGDADLVVIARIHFRRAIALMTLVIMDLVIHSCVCHDTCQIRIRRIGNRILICLFVCFRNRIVPRRRRRQIGDLHIRPGHVIRPDHITSGVRHHHRDAVSGILQDTP